MHAHLVNVGFIMCFLSDLYFCTIKYFCFIAKNWFVVQTTHEEVETEWRRSTETAMTELLKSNVSPDMNLEFR